MKKKSLKLQDLKVKSFITNSQSLTLKAGIENYDTLEVVGGTGCGCPQSLATDVIVTCPGNASVIISPCMTDINNTCSLEQSIENAFCNKKTRQANCHNITVIC